MWVALDRLLQWKRLAVPELKQMPSVRPCRKSNLQVSDVLRLCIRSQEQLEYSQVPSAVGNLILSYDRNHLSLKMIGLMEP